MIVDMTGMQAIARMEKGHFCTIHTWRLALGAAMKINSARGLERYPECRDGRLSAGVAPEVFPLFVTARYYFSRPRDRGVLDLFDEALACFARRPCGLDEELMAVIIDRESVRTTEAGRPRGFDGGKKFTRRKRNIATDM